MSPDDSSFIKLVSLTIIVLQVYRIDGVVKIIRLHAQMYLIACVKLPKINGTFKQKLRLDMSMWVCLGQN